MSVRAERSGRVTTVILDRPGVRNAVDGPTAAALAGAFRDFDADDGADVAHAIADGKDVNDVWVGAVMTTRPAVVTTASVRLAAKIMTARHLRHLPVAGDAGLLAVVDIIDACRALISAGPR